MVTRQIAVKERVTGEAQGISFDYVSSEQYPLTNTFSAQSKNIDNPTLSARIHLKEILEKTVRDVRTKSFNMTLAEVKDLLFRCAAALSHENEVGEVRLAKT